MKVFLLLTESFEEGFTHVEAFADFPSAYSKLCKQRDEQDNIFEQGKDYFCVEDTEYDEAVGWQVSLLEKEIQGDLREYD